MTIFYSVFLYITQLIKVLVSRPVLLFCNQFLFIILVFYWEPGLLNCSTFKPQYISSGPTNPIDFSLAEKHVFEPF